MRLNLKAKVLSLAIVPVLLFAVAGYVLYEAWRRFYEPAEVQSVAMLVVESVIGLRL